MILDGGWMLDKQVLVAGLKQRCTLAGNDQARFPTNHGMHWYHKGQRQAHVSLLRDVENGNFDNKFSEGGREESRVENIIEDLKARGYVVFHVDSIQKKAGG